MFFGNYIQSWYNNPTITQRVVLRKLLLVALVVALSYAFIRNEHFLHIAAGIAIFLLGMQSLSEGFRYFVGGLLEKFLKRMTDKLYKSLIFGATLTTIMQSSGLLAIITISFLGAGFINLSQAIGISLGGNIGTTTGAWLIAAFGLKISIATYAMPMLVFGTLLYLQKTKRLKGIGLALIGLGFSFLGIAYMKEGFDAFKDTLDLTLYSADGFRGIVIFAIIGTVMTILMQSSHASLVLILAALSASQITYENAIAMTLGANIGTTITAILGSFGASIEGKKLAASHFLSNTLTGLLLIWLIPQFIILIDCTAPFLGIGKEEYTLKLALYHTYFNVACVLIFAPLIKQLVAVLDFLFRAKIPKEDEKDEARFVNDAALDFPDTTYVALFKEIKHLYDNAFEGISKGMSFSKEDVTSGMEADDIIALRSEAISFDMDAYYEKRIKEIYGQIITFAITAQGRFADEEAHRIIPIRNATVSIVEAYKATKHMQKNMLKYLMSENVYIKNAYNHIRWYLITHLRTMQLLFNANDANVINLLLDKLQLDAQKYDFASNKELDELIRSNKISYDMATSLMNDATYAHTIASELSKVAYTLLSQNQEKKEEHADG